MNRWTWSMPGAPIRVNISLDVMRRLKEQTAAAVEVGGFLLGSAESGIVDIHDFTCQPSLSPARAEYHLDTNHIPANAAGFFRTQLRGGFELREAELDLVKQHFADPSNVVLLIQPEANRAGLFFWWGDIFTPCSFKDFPLSAARVPKAPSRMPRKALAAAACVAVIAGLCGYLLGEPRQMPAPPSVATANIAAESPRPKLELEARGEGFNVTWGARNDAVDGSLVIIQPGRPDKYIALDPKQLSEGRLYVRSVSESVQFRLEVLDWEGGFQRESISAFSAPRQEIPRRISRKIKSLPGDRPKIPQPTVAAFWR